MDRQLFMSHIPVFPPQNLHGSQNLWKNLRNDHLQKVKDGSGNRYSSLQAVLENFSLNDFVLLQSNPSENSASNQTYWHWSKYVLFKKGLSVTHEKWLLMTRKKNYVSCEKKIQFALNDGYYRILLSHPQWKLSKCKVQSPYKEFTEAPCIMWCSVATTNLPLCSHRSSLWYRILHSAHNFHFLMGPESHHKNCWALPTGVCQKYRAPLIETQH